GRLNDLPPLLIVRPSAFPLISITGRSASPSTYIGIVVGLVTVTPPPPVPPMPSKYVHSNVTTSLPHVTSFALIIEYAYGSYAVKVTVKKPRSATRSTEMPSVILTLKYLSGSSPKRN